MKLILTLLLSLLLCAARPVKVNLFGVANNIPYIVRVDDSTFVQIVPGNQDKLCFLAHADSGAIVAVISGWDTTITQVKPASKEVVLHVHPNPVDRELTLRFDGVENPPGRSFDLFDVRGSHILSIPAQGRAVTIQLPPLASGVYFWRCGAATGKLTVLH